MYGYTVSSGQTLKAGNHPEGKQIKDLSNRERLESRSLSHLFSDLFIKVLLSVLYLRVCKYL